MIWTGIFRRTSFLNSNSRYIFTSGVTRNDLQGNDEEMAKNLNKFLSDGSPLKDFNNSDWATTPYPLGTITPKDVDSQVSVDPESTSVIMFPGQGNQYVGMGKYLMHHPVVEDMFEAASSILGYNLKKLCLSDPEGKLNRTEYCQPATLVCSLAAVEELKQKYPTALTSCIATAGFSVGEIAALVFAGCISFDKAVNLTRIRAEAMQICSDAVKGGMLSVLYGADSDLSTAMKDAVEECKKEGIEDPVCQIANYLIPECKILAGHDAALNYIEKNIKKYKIRKVSRLNVSGAFHTKLMQEASKPVSKALKKIEINNPIIPVISCVTAKPYRDSAHILSLFPKQIYSPVKWEQVINTIYKRPDGVGFPHTYECGPGKSLSTIMKRLNFKAYRNFHNVYA